MIASPGRAAGAGAGAGAGANPAWEWLRGKLASTPGRTREAFWVALAAVTAIALSLFSGVVGGIAALLVLQSLSPTSMCNWRTLPRRLAFVVVPALLVVPVGGFLLQIPPVFVPALFAAITALLYFHPVTRYAFDAYAALLVIVIPLYRGALDGRLLAPTAGSTAFEVGLAAVVATVFFELARPGGVRLRLSAALEGSFRDERTRLARVVDRAPTGDPAEMPRDFPRTTAIRLVDQVRQEGLSDDEDRLLVLLTSTAERAGSFVSTLEAIVGEGPVRLSPGVAAAARALVAGLDRALDGFARASHAIRDGVPTATPGEAPWPDLFALRADLERAQQVAAAERDSHPGRDGDPTARDRERRAAWIAALGALAQVLHASPTDLHGLVREDPRDLLDIPSTGPGVQVLDPIRLRYALQVALSMTICFHLGLATHLTAPVTFLWSPLMTMQTSLGATIRKAWLRAAGVLAGSAFSLALVIGFMSGSDDVALWLALLLAILFACEYVALGEPRWWYAGYQAAATVMLLVVAERPVQSVDGVLWRIWGVVLGLSVLFTVMRLVAPDTAARQVVRRWRDLGRILTRLLPGPGAKPAPMADLVRNRLEVGRIGADLLRLVDELRVEGDTELEPDDVVEATGLAMRSAYRAGLVARARALAPPDASPDDPVGFAADADAAAAAHARSIRDALENAAKQASLPRKRRGDGAAVAREEVVVLDADGGSGLPDLGAEVDALSHRLEERGPSRMPGRTTRQVTEIMSSVENLRRLSVLMPRLETALGRVLRRGATAAVVAATLLATGCATMRPPINPLRAVDPESLAPSRSDRTWEPGTGVVPTPVPGAATGAGANGTADGDPSAPASANGDSRARPSVNAAGESRKSQPGSEDQAAKGPLDLPELIDLGLRESPSTRAAWEASRGAAARVGRSLEPYYPRLQTAVRAAPNERLLFQDSPQTLVAHQRAFEPQVSLTYTLLDFGRRARSAEVARERLLQSNFSFNRELQRVAYDVSYAYFMLDAAIALEAAATENVELARRVREAATRRLDVGLGTRPDVLLAEQVETRSLYDRESAAAGIRAAEAQLGRALGRDASRVPRVRPLGGRAIPSDLDANVDALIARAMEERPDLAAREAEVRARVAETDRARADFLPTIGFDGNYGFDSWHYSLGSTRDIRTNQPTWSTAFRFDWDVFRGFGRENAVREAKAATAQAQAALERERIDASAEVWTAYFDYQAARRKLDYAEALLSSAKEAYEGTAKSYENGLADIVALLTAERDLATARATRVRARAELLTSAARLGYSVGLVVPEAGGG